MAAAKKKARWWELPLLAVLAIVVAIGIKTWVAQPFYVPSGSMEKTLHGCAGCDDDRILVNKTIYDLRDPHPGDVVVFHAPAGWDDEPASTPPSNPVLKGLRGLAQLIGFVPPDGEILVKRVIASGGQTVRGDASGHVFVSEHGTAGPFRELHEPYVYEPTRCPCDAFGPVTVPAGRLWVMGDHRDDSLDSRYHCNAAEELVPAGQPCDATMATVPDASVIGKAVWVIWPASHWRELGTPATFADPAFPLGGAAFAAPLLWWRRRR